MLSKLPDLLDKNFFVGYVLPVTAFLIVLRVLANDLDFSSPILESVLQGTSDSPSEALVETTIFALVAWLLGVLLLILNREIIRVFEGYGWWNPLRLLSSLQKRRYITYQNRINELGAKRDAYEASGENAPEEILDELAELEYKFVEKFPRNVSWLLPTSLGNTIRAFETYSSVMYGFDSIPGWNRLLTVIPEEYIGFINEAKAYVDFWINVLTLSLALLPIHAFLAINQGQTRSLGFSFMLLPAAFIVIAAVAYNGAKVAAVEWGDVVKAAIDVYLVELRAKLKFAAPGDAQAERAIWLSFSQAVLYLQPDSIPKKDYTRTESKGGDACSGVGDGAEEVISRVQDE